MPESLAHASLMARFDGFGFVLTMLDDPAHVPAMSRFDGRGMAARLMCRLRGFFAVSVRVLMCLTVRRNLCLAKVSGDWGARVTFAL